MGALPGNPDPEGTEQLRRLMILAAAKIFDGNPDQRSFLMRAFGHRLPPKEELERIRKEADEYAEARRLNEVERRRYNAREKMRRYLGRKREENSAAQLRSIITQLSEES